MTPALTPTRPAPEQRRRERLRERRRRAIRRRRAGAGLAIAAIVVLAIVVSTSLQGGAGDPRPMAAVDLHAPPARAPYAVHELTTVYVDSTRAVSLPTGERAPRRLVTRVFYPVPPAGRRLPGPFPLVVFAHGLALAPEDYQALLTAWARAGYVVAAPVFPLETRGAPGGPTASDLSNEPGDMSFVITRLLAASASSSSPLTHLINGGLIAVAGHADGGDSALSVAEGTNRDHRVGAAIVLAGAELPGQSLDTGGPPLLAVQGTADPVNAPAATDAYLSALDAPKFLLALSGARHVSPFSSQQPQLGVVERVTLDFLDRYLKGSAPAAGALARDAAVTGVAQLAVNAP